MSQVSISAGGSPIPSGDTVTVDQTTIRGAGTPQSPLHVVTVAGVTRLTSASVPAGTPVYIKPDNLLHPGDALVIGRALLVGLLRDGVASGTAGTAQASGQLTLTVDEWDVVAGTSGGLTPGVPYYLSATSGELTSTAPTTSTQLVVQVGIGISATTMLLSLPGIPVEIP